MVGILAISGLAFSMTLQLVALSGDNVFLLLLLIAVLAFVLGIGLPTVSVYILTATLLAPALVKLGVTPMAAHMFVMYNGMLSMITPPVAFAAYAAASIARTDGWTTGWVACLVGWSTFVLPFLFVLTPSLLMDGPAYLIVWNFARILFGLFIGTAAILGFALAPLSIALARALRPAGPADRLPPDPFGVTGHTINFVGIVGAHCAAGRGAPAAAKGRGRAEGGVAPRRGTPSCADVWSTGIHVLLVGDVGKAAYAAFSRQMPSASCAGRSEIENSTDSFLAWWSASSRTAPRTRRAGPIPASDRRPWSCPRLRRRPKSSKSVDW